MKQRDPMTTKQMILEAAIVVFNQKGYARTTLGEIARAAGVSRGSIYWHFKGKELIFLALMGSWIDTLYALFLQLQDDEQRSTEEKLRLLLEQSLLNPGKNILYLSSEFWNHHQTEKETLNHLQELYQRYQEIFRGLLFDGMIRNEFKTIDIEEVTASFMGMIEGIFSHQLLKNRDRPTSSRAFVTGVEIFLAGIRKSSQEEVELDC